MNLVKKATFHEKAKAITHNFTKFVTLNAKIGNNKLTI